MGGMAGLRRLRDRLRPPRPEDGGAPRILVLAFDHQVGAIVATTPLFRALRQARPAAHVTVAGSGLVASVLRHNPRIDRVVTMVDPHDSVARVIAGAVAGVVTGRGDPHAGRYDWLVSTVGCRRRVLGALALSLPAGRRAGFSCPQALAHYDAPVAFDTRASTVVNNLRALAPFGVAAEPCEPEMHFDAASLERVEALLARHGVGAGCRRAAFIVQTSGGQPTDWFPDRFAAVADRLADSHGLRPVFVGTAEGRDAIDAVRCRMRAPGSSLAGETSVAELAALLAGSDLAVAVDTGAMHVARGVGVPMVVVASAWQEPHHWLPLGVDTCAILSRPDIGCAPCLKSFCATRDCLTAVTAEEVAAAAAALLARFPPTAAARRARVEARLTTTRHGAP